MPFSFLRDFPHEIFNQKTRNYPTKIKDRSTNRLLYNDGVRLVVFLVDTHICVQSVEEN